MLGPPIRVNCFDNWRNSSRNCTTWQLPHKFTTPIMGKHIHLFPTGSLSGENQGKHATFQEDVCCCGSLRWVATRLIRQAHSRGRKATIACMYAQAIIAACCLKSNFENLPFYVFGTQISQQPHMWLLAMLQQQLLQKHFQQYHLLDLYKKITHRESTCARNRKVGWMQRNRKPSICARNRKLGGMQRNRKLGWMQRNRKLGGMQRNRKLGWMIYFVWPYFVWLYA